MRLVLAKVLYNFDLELDEDRDKGNWLEDQVGWAVWWKGPLYVKLSLAKN